MNKSKGKSSISNDYMFNFKHAMFSAIGFVVLLGATAVQIIIFAKMNTNFECNRNEYRNLSSMHHTLISKQNTVYSMKRSAKFMALDRKKGLFRNMRQRDIDMLILMEVAEHVKRCKRILGSKNFQQVLNKFGRLPQEGDTLPAFLPSVSNLTLKSYYLMDAAQMAFRNRRETARFEFLVIYLIGSFFVAFGIFRRKHGKIMRAYLIKWGAAFLLLVVWVLQNFVSTKLGAKSEDIKEIRFRVEDLTGISELYLQTRMRLGEQRLEQGGSIDSVTQMEENLRQYLWHHLKHINYILFSNLNSHHQVELKDKYNSLQEYPKGDYNYLRTDEYILFCQGFQFGIMGHEFREELGQFATRQLICKYILIILATIGTTLLIWSQFLCIREENK